jgi:hypothetical protein
MGALSLACEASDGKSRERPLWAACAVLACACAAAPQHQSARDTVQCEFQVYNRTPHALEIRMGVRAFSTAPIGALNPSEMLSRVVPCASRHVWIVGIPIPAQVGAPVAFRLVQGEGDLIAGERVEIDLHWP